MSAAPMNRKSQESDDKRGFDPDVLSAELTQVYRRRISQGQENPDSPALGELSAKPDSALPQARAARCVGLALSGGGIRSATFNLGLLQGLARLGVLRAVDYLSTVSGGGYIGAWLAAWVQREGDFQAVERRLADRDKASDDGAAVLRDPINHLRRYSNYLAPEQGLLSADRWVLWANYLRNFLLNQMVLLPLLIILLLCVRFFMWLYYPWSKYLDQALAPPGYRPIFEPNTMHAMTVMAWVGGIFLIASLVSLFYAARMVATREKFVESYDHSRWTAQHLVLPILLLVGFAFVACAFAPYELATIIGEMLPGWREALAPYLPAIGTLWVVELLWFCVVTMLLSLACYALSRLLPPWGGEGIVGWELAAVTGAGLVAGPLLYGVFCLLHQPFVWDGSAPEGYLRVSATAWSLTVGPPALLLALVAIVSIGVGFLKEHIRPELKEWWASVCARVLFHAACWLAFFVLALYAAPLVLWMGPYLRAVLTSSWVLTVVAGVLAGGSAKTGWARSNRFLETLAWLGPYLFLVGFLVGVSILLHHVVDYVPRWQDADEEVWVRRLDPPVPHISDTLSRISKASDDRSHEAPLGNAATAKPPHDVMKDVQESRSVEHREVVSSDEILKQMYWVGFLNTTADFVPQVKEYNLRKAVDHFNETLGNGNNRLDDKLRQDTYTMQEKDKFEEAISKLLEGKRPRTRYLYRFHLIQWAKEVQLWPDPDKGDTARARKLGTWILCVAAVMLLAMWRVDVNLMSLQSVYGNRLVRCYLGASRPVEGPRQCRKRQPDPITGFDPNDDLYLDQLQQNTAPLPGQPLAGKTEPVYNGPYLIINASLNLVHANRLDWQERKAESFILTPRFCGSDGTCYRRTDRDPTSDHAYADRLWLGTAVTISGAAASPNMGYHSSPAVTALLTVFNARLGSWLGNPSDPATWHTSGPRLGFLHLFRELFGLTSAKGEYVFLSDGGHFENLGAYELVRRRCQYIIVSDAGNDPAHTFEDLSNLIHKCRVDFGIEIEINPDSLRPSERGLCAWHCAVGQIRYDRVDPQASPGILVYLKPSLTGDEPTDVLQYRERHPAFPHDPTTNQFFTESQFESYRALGEHIAGAVFSRAIDEVREDLERDHKIGITRKEGATIEHRRWCLDLFTSVVRQWYSLPPKYEMSFLDSTKGFIEIQTALRTQPLLWRLSLEIYPEMDADGSARRQLRAERPDEVIRRRSAEIHLVSQMLQVMENAWLSLDLDAHYAHPLNRGWLDVFHRWTNAPTVRELWPTLRAEFARGFGAFCEKQMGMSAIEVSIQPMRQQAAADWERFLQELQDQVPTAKKPPSNGASLWDWEKWIKHAKEQGEQDVQRALGWYIFSRNTPARAEPAEAIPCGIIVLHPLREKGVCELFVWMRGAYRNSGLGRLALRELLHKVLPERKDVERLRAHLPTLEMRGPAAKLQESMWLTFFYHHGFFPRSQDKKTDYVVLEWTKHQNTRN